MLFNHLLTGRAQMVSDVRTYWSAEAVKLTTGWEPKGPASGGFIHLINSGASALDACGKMREDGVPAIKRFWDISQREAKDCLEATSWCPANTGYFRGGGYSSRFLTEGGMPVTMCRINLVRSAFIQSRGGIQRAAERSSIINERQTRPPSTFLRRLTAGGLGRLLRDNCWRKPRREASDIRLSV
jgi:L-fucose isomerase